MASAWQRIKRCCCLAVSDSVIIFLAVCVGSCFHLGSDVIWIYPDSCLVHRGGVGRGFGGGAGGRGVSHDERQGGGLKKDKYGPFKASACMYAIGHTAS